MSLFSGPVGSGRNASHVTGDQVERRHIAGGEASDKIRDDRDQRPFQQDWLEDIKLRVNGGLEDYQAIFGRTLAYLTDRVDENHVGVGDRRQCYRYLSRLCKDPTKAHAILAAFERFFQEGTESASDAIVVLRLAKILVKRFSGNAELEPFYRRALNASHTTLLAIAAIGANETEKDLRNLLTCLFATRLVPSEQARLLEIIDNSLRHNEKRQILANVLQRYLHVTDSGTFGFDVASVDLQHDHIRTVVPELMERFGENETLMTIGAPIASARREL